MPLRGGIVGLPNVGKSTLFNALTSGKALAANYPFATKDPNIGMIVVPDPRLDALSNLVKPLKIIPNTIEIVDIAGLIKGASQGEGLGNQFLANIREVEAIVHVVRCFEDDNVIHVDGSIDPARDKEIIDMELLFKDMETLDKRIDRLKKQTKGSNKDEARQLELAIELKKHLEIGKAARLFSCDPKDQPLLDELFLLTGKPIVYVCNVEEASVHTGNKHTQALMQVVEAENKIAGPHAQAEVILISAAIEAEIAQLETKEERKEFIEAIGLDEPGVNKVIRSCYKLLDLITYFTAGEKEVRAWTIHVGDTAPKAAGVIHTDFEKGFIRAEVISYQDYIKYGSEHAAREAGRLMVHGKEYLVQDGDVMHFRFNV
jgi:GTP-binding protein YchF